MFTFFAIITGLTLFLYMQSFGVQQITNNISSIEKQSAYECGFEPTGDAKIHFEIQFYVTAVLFIIFDLEVIFLFPQATILNQLNYLWGFTSIIIFQIIVTIGQIYEIKMGAIDIV